MIPPRRHRDHTAIRTTPTPMMMINSSYRSAPLCLRRSLDAPNIDADVYGWSLATTLCLRVAAALACSFKGGSPRLLYSRHLFLRGGTGVHISPPPLVPYNRLLRSIIRWPLSPRWTNTRPQWVAPLACYGWLLKQRAPHLSFFPLTDVSGITDILQGFSPYWLSPITREEEEEEEVRIQ